MLPLVGLLLPFVGSRLAWSLACKGRAKRGGMVLGGKERAK